MNREEERLSSVLRPLSLEYSDKLNVGLTSEGSFWRGQDFHCRFSDPNGFRYVNRDLIRVKPSVAGLMIVRMWRLCGSCAWWTMSIPTWVV